MKAIILILVANLISIISSCIAGYMALKNIEGWDWFLFIAVICSQSIKAKNIKL
jgi:hypothetical protein